MAVFELAEKYGKAPEEVANWDSRWFDRAWDYHMAKNTEKWLDGDGFDPQVAPKSNTTLLDHERAFWMHFVVDGKLDADKLIAANYAEAQIPWLQGEMIKLGWLPS